MKRILATTALVALTASAAFAESHVDAEDGTAMEATESTEMTATGEMGEPMADIDGLTVNASDLLGKRVYVRGEANPEAEIGDTLAEPDADWEDVGEIGDVIISAEGEIQSVVLDAGGFLGIGEKEVSTSMDELKFVREEGNEEEYFVVYTGNRAALEEQDELDRDMTRDEGWTFYGDRGEMEDREEADVVSVTEQAEPEAEMEESDAPDGSDTVIITGDTDAQMDASTTDMTDNEEVVNDDEVTVRESDEPREDDVVAQDMDASEDAGRDVMTAEDLEGLNVYDGTGEDIGEISDLVITMDGQISAVIVDVGGFLGIGEKPVALSFDKIEIGRDDNGNLVASTAYTEEEMEAAQSFEY